MATASSKQNKIFTGTFIHTPTFGSLDIAHDQAVGVDETGTIVFIEPLASLSTVAASHGFNAANTRYISSAKPNATTFFFPGLIDTHTHASQYPNVGIFGSSTLLSWLETYTFPLESSFADLARARLVYDRVVARTLAHGTTTAAYYGTVHVPATNLLADICLARGQRALVGRVCMDRMSPDHYRDASPASAAADSAACIAHCRAIDPSGSLVRPCITPRFAPSCTPAALTALGSLQQSSGAWAQTHISENTNEIALVASQNPDAKDYASVYDAAGLLGPRTILAHAIHLTPAEVSLVAARGAHISHCPASNTCLTSGAARVRDLLDAGASVTLGTDMSGGPSPSVLDATRQALGVSRHVAAGTGVDRHRLAVEEALYLATRAGARALGLQDAVGVFRVGFKWDAMLVGLDNVVGEGSSQELGSIGPVDVFGWEAWPDLVAKWVYGGDDRNVRCVWVNGRLVHGEVEEGAWPS